MNKSLAIGCVVVSAVLAIMATVAVVMGPKLFTLAVNTFKSAMADVQRVSDFEEKWNRPGEELGASWFPKSVGAWELKGEPGPVTGAPELDNQGWEAVYASGGETVKVQVRAASSLEKEALMAREKEEHEHESGTRSSSQLGNRYSFTANGTEHKVVWWIHGWFFVFRSQGKTELVQFAESYLNAISAAKGEAEPKGDGAEKGVPAGEKPGAE